MLILALDTASPLLSVALLDGDRVSAEVGYGPEASASVLLPRALADLVSSCGRRLLDISAIAVGLGPGSFTGLRVGLATAKGLAYALRVPMSGASSLAAMARAARHRVAGDTLLVPCLCARREEVYAGFYRAGTGERVWDEVATTPEALARRVRGLGAAAVLFGLGRDENPIAFGDLPAVPQSLPKSPLASSVAALVQPLGEYDQARLFAMEPHYIRPSEAEVRFPLGLTGPPRRPRRPQARRRPVP